MMAGYLEADNIKVQGRRVRSSLRRIDPASCEKRCGKTAKRRTYSVPTSNHLWHIDGHMKLNRLAINPRIKWIVPILIFWSELDW